jgi:host factor-I protein
MKERGISMSEGQGELHIDFSQDSQLNMLRKDQLECTIITTNGVQMRGKIHSFDKFAVLVSDQSGKLSMLYKHALSTIIARR